MSVSVRNAALPAVRGARARQVGAVKYILRRVLMALLTLWLVTVVVFGITNVLPGNPALARLGPFVSAKALQAEERSMGLDRPLIDRYVSYVGGVLHGNLGVNYETGNPVSQDLLNRLPATLELALAATMLACAVGIPLGFGAALRRGTWIDRVARTLSSFASAMPSFWLALILIYVLAYKLRIAPPPTGRLPIGAGPPPHITGFYVIDSALTGNSGLMWTAIRFLALPAIALCIVELAPIVKVARSAMVAVLETDYVRTARALGFGSWYIFLRHELRNSLVPVITMLGLVFGQLMSGNVVVETVFAWPGIGQYAYQAMASNDFNATQGFILAVATLYIVINLIIDLLYVLIDPRIQLR